MRQRRIGAAVLLAALGGAPSRIEAQLSRASFIAGQSLGGEEVSSIGARHADRVAGLIYLDPSTGAYDDGNHGDFVVDVAELKNHLDALRADGAKGQVAQMDSVLTVLRQIDLPAFETALARTQGTLRFLPRVLIR